jgi:membrane protease YdiL (CAAX protease family)
MIFFAIGTLFLLLLLCWSTFRSAIYLREIQPTFNLLLLPAENVVRLLLIAVCIWLALSSALPFARFGWNVVDPARDIVIGFAVGIVVVLALPTVTRIAIARFGTKVYSPVVVQSILPRNSRESLLVPFALIPAVLLEELLFRALLLGGFAVFAPPFLLALVWSFLFGVMHLPQGLLGMVVAGLLGLLLSALFLSTASLLAPIIAHYVINLLQIAWASRDKFLLQSYSRDPSDHS